MADRDYLMRLTKELTDQGKLIESGWAALRLIAIPDDAPPVQLKEMRMAFFAGAQHLFSSILSFIEEGGEEPTASDLARMDMVVNELKEFVDKELKARQR